MMNKKWDVDGYYFDGKKSWIIYVNKDGKTKMKEWKDE
tara:strand:- start:813 stop:926 length:114 start_codon:yes stop_codon:yes gene_type:complete